MDVGNIVQINVQIIIKINKQLIKFIFYFLGNLNHNEWATRNDIILLFFLQRFILGCLCFYYEEQLGQDNTAALRRRNVCYGQPMRVMY